MTHLIHIVGAGPLSATRYRLDGAVSAETEHIALALAELEPLSRATLLATPFAREQRGEAIREGMAERNVPAILVDFPDGSDPTQQWQQFQCLQEALTSGGRDTPILLDITHGFRSAPFMAGAVVSFVQAVSEQPLTLRIVYGAFDKTAEASPIWDLSVVNAVQAWARDLRSFLRTGRAAEAANSLEALGREMQKRWAQGGRDPETQPRISPVAKALRAFSEDLQTLRTGALLLGDGHRQPGSAVALATALEASRGQIAKEVPPLAAVLEQVEQLLSPFSEPLDDLVGPQGHAQVAALADLYQRLERPLEALATLREGRVNLFSGRAATVPGRATFNDEARHGAEQRAGKIREGGLIETRNDVLHAGYRAKSMPAQTIHKEVAKALAAFREATPQRLFLNLSNHPVAHWSAAQVAAAAAEVGMDPDQDPVDRWLVEVPFPAVDPWADGQSVARLAEAVAAQQVPESVCVAMVQGEFTLTMALVSRLQARGIQCVAATRHRLDPAVATEGFAGAPEAPGSFVFGAFRAYETLTRLSSPVGDGTEP